MYDCKLSERDKKFVEEARYDKRYQNLPITLRKRLWILWYKSLGYPHGDIAKLSGASINTVTATLRRYHQGGIERVLEWKPHRPQSELGKHCDRIKLNFAERPPLTLKKAASDIEALTGIKRSLGSVRTFLLSIGMDRRKVGMIPGKGNPDKQEEFINNKLQPVLDEAIAGQRHVYFVDAAHFVLAPFLGFLWSFTRLFIKAPAGRNRFNVLGALNAITHEIITVTNHTYINAASVCELLHKIAACHVDGAITLILDNAKYQKCLIVTELALTLNIDLLYLPPYSPNLNLIERLWRFVKKEALYCKYYEDFTKFKSAISKCLDDTRTEYKDEMRSLFTLKFQRIRKSQIIAI
jgi:transposase